jgi:hypothetical protein
MIVVFSMCAFYNCVCCHILAIFDVVAIQKNSVYSLKTHVSILGYSTTIVDHVTF